MDSVSGEVLAIDHDPRASAATGIGIIYYLT
jgi:hypothetical protein